ncbi:MAG: hypothetical protein GY719_26170 [bacterium]|nr:hypothetical protein [bacterium]
MPERVDDPFLFDSGAYYGSEAVQMMDERQLRARCHQLNHITGPGQPHRTDAEQDEFLAILRRLGTHPGDPDA